MTPADVLVEETRWYFVLFLQRLVRFNRLVHSLPQFLAFSIQPIEFRLELDLHAMQ